MIGNLAKPGQPPAPLPIVPPYKLGGFGVWRLEAMPDTVLPGYFSSIAHVKNNISLRERPKPSLKKWRTWMSLSPMEMESHILPVAEAHGHVVICGLGMGMALYNIASKPEVTRVTVIENDRRVVQMFNQCADWGDWPGKGKVTLYVDDALGFVPENRPHPETLYPDESAEELAVRMARFAWTDVDYLYVDIWPTLGAWQAVADVQLIAANLAPAAVAWWGQEFDFVSFLADRSKAGERAKPSLALFEEWRTSTKLPVIGGDYPNYPELAVQAVRVQARVNYQPSKIERKKRSPLAV